MRLWLRIIWRTLEWPVNLVAAWVPFAFTFYYGWGYFPQNKSIPMRGGLCLIGDVVFVFGGILLVAAQLDKSSPLNGQPMTRFLTDQFRKMVAEERKKMQMERGTDNKDTFLRAAGGEE